MPVLTLSLQSLAAVLILLFGITALAVARHREAFPEMHRTPWWITGIAWVILGASAVLHGIGAVGAYFTGAGSLVYDTFLRWTPVGNHSRAVLVIAFACLLLWMLRFRASARFEAASSVWGWLLLAIVMGGAVGWWEGAYSEARHWSVFALLSLLGLLVLLAAVFGALVTRTMDWYLWLSLLIYALHLGLHVIWYSALAWTRVPAAWSPHPWQIHLYAVTAYGLMLALALHRLILARRGVRVASAMEFIERPRFSSLG